jgi:hypothetical protein
MNFIGTVVGVVGLLLMTVGWIWTVVLAFKRSAMLGALCLFWPISFMYGFGFGKPYTRRAGSLSALGFCLCGLALMAITPIH